MKEYQGIGLDRTHAMVKDFHVEFNHPVSEKPTMLSKERAAKRMSWIKEEVQEFMDAETIPDQADAMIDTIYFAIGTLVEMGVKPERLMEIVQDANMSKLWPDGKAHYKADGKVQKPEGWQDPFPKLVEAIADQNK